MPCRSCPDESSRYTNTSSQTDNFLEGAETRKKLDEVTALLCDTLNELKARKPITYASLLGRSKNLYNWWTKHQLDDEKRTGKKFNRVKLKK